MIHRIVRSSLAFLLIAALIIPPPAAQACGPDFATPTYTRFESPDDKDFAYERGQLGLLQRGYWHIYLFEAYRNLSGQPFNEAEIKALKNWSGGPNDDKTTEGNSANRKTQEQDWIANWYGLRDEALGKPATPRVLYHDERGIIRSEFRDKRFFSYYNCLSDAFQNAVRIAGERKKQFGAESAVYHTWVATQDQVFENCADASGYPPKPKPALIPVSANPEEPEIIRADRAYQIAAAHFYAAELDAAQTAFAQIAKDQKSPYRKIASYLIARVLLRKAFLSAEEGQFDATIMAQAETQLSAVMADKESPELQRAAARLLNFVRIRLHPVERLHELEDVLLSGKPTETWEQSLNDYLWLLDHPAMIAPAKLSQQSASGTAPSSPSATKKLGAGSTDLSDWILTFQQAGEPTFRHSFERWQETKSLPWLVAAITKVDAKNNEEATALSAAASKINAASPAYITVSFHRIRLLEQSGQTDAACRELDLLLAQHGKPMPISAQNQFRALRMKLAVNLSEFLQFALRTPANADNEPPAVNGDANSQPSPSEPIYQRPHFDSDASVILTEKLPLQDLVTAAKSSALPLHLKRDITIAAWTRAVLLKKEAVALELSPALADLVPELKSQLAEFHSAADPAGQEFAAICAILRNPGFRPFVSANPERGGFYSYRKTGFDQIENLHDNWWCRLGPKKTDEGWMQNYYSMFSDLSKPLRDIYPSGVVSDPTFLSKEERAAVQQERESLIALPAAPAWLGEQTLAWSKAHPEDPRVPEALHLVVRAWHYGCHGDGEVNYSKEAFQLLHKRYPQSEWTKKTPYFY